MTKEEIIGRIVNELPQLTDAELKEVYNVVRTVRAAPPNKPSKESSHSPGLPFVDEIERVKEQSRRVPDHQEDQQFT